MQLGCITDFSNSYRGRNTDYCRPYQHTNTSAEVHSSNSCLLFYLFEYDVHMRARSSTASTYAADKRAVTRTCELLSWSRVTLRAQRSVTWSLRHWRLCSLVVLLIHVAQPRLAMRLPHRRPRSLLPWAISKRQPDRSQYSALSIHVFINRQP